MTHEIAQLLPGFTQLNDSVYFLKTAAAPSSSLIQRKDAAPDLILLLSWGGAHLRNVAKYTDHYNELFGNVPLLLVRTEFKHILKHTPTSQDLFLEPVISIIKDSTQLQGMTTNQRSSKHRLLVHVFSNGGSYKLIEIARRYKQKTGHVMPIDTLFFDSAPGVSTIRKSVKAISYALPESWFLRLTGVTLLYFGLFILHVYSTLFGREHLMTAMRRRLNEPGLIDKSSKRCYIYSIQDELVEWIDVQAHAEDARRREFDVHEELFELSQHVAHAREDPKRYWSIIGEQWKR